MAIAKNSVIESASIIRGEIVDSTAVWTGNENNNWFIGSANGDIAHGLGGDDRLYGNDGNDFLYGDDGDDALKGGTGSDRLFGGDGFDVLAGGDGLDDLTGGTGADRVFGGAGDDYLHVAAGDLVMGDLMDGGDGTDTVVAEGFDNVTIDLQKSLLIDNVSGETFSFENIENGEIINWDDSAGAGLGSGTIIATDESNILYFSGNEGTILGMGGDDDLTFAGNQGTIFGGDGDDTLHIFPNPVAGPTYLSFNGGEGSDSIEFMPGMISGQTTWNDFSQAEHDQIDLRYSGWDSYQEMIDAGVTITQVGGDTLIQYEGGMTLALEGFTGTLGEDDFVF